MVSDMAQRALVIGIVFSVALHMAVLAIPFSLKTGQNLVTHFQEVRLSFYHQIKSKPITSKTKQAKKTKSKTVSHHKRNLVSQKKIFKKPAPVKKTEKTEENKFRHYTVPVVKNNYEKKIEKTTKEDNAPEPEKKTVPEETAAPGTKDINASSKKLDKPKKTNDSNIVTTSDNPSISDKTITKTENKTTDEDEVYRGGFGGSNGPKFLKKVIPRYPRIARKLGKEGRVVLKLFIDKKGRLKKVEVIEDDGYGFAREAVKAIKESTFLPAVRKGIPVDSEALLTVRFRLKD